VELERTIRVHAPAAGIVSLVTESAVGGGRVVTPMLRSGDDWVGTLAAAHGDRYWLVADGVGPLLDPSAFDVELTERGPVSVVRATPWPLADPLGHHHPDPVVYELHVRGFAHTFAGAIERLPYLADLGVNVIEVMPIHPFDTSDNYWGYMPIVWGAVHRPYSASADAASEFAAFVHAAHGRDIEVWVDVVFNHTGEGDATMPTWCLRGLDDAGAYRHRDAGSYFDDSGCGNDINPSNENVRRLVMEALDRYADLGVDGFRFDLASLLTRDGGELVKRIGDWAERRGVVLVAEAWDLGAYQVGAAFPDDRWMQWNDRFRDDMRGFLRSEPGLVPAVIQRVSGSPDIFGAGPSRSLNFLDAHDGLTLHDLTAVTSDRHRSWDCGPELRPQQLANAFCLLLLSAGSPMFVMGDEFARTQQGHDNPYNIDGPITWVDWSRIEQWQALRDTVRRLIRVRARADFSTVRCYGVNLHPDTTHESRSLAWSAGDVYVIANMWFDDLLFQVHEPGPWVQVVCTAGRAPSPIGGSVTVAARSIVVLVRDRRA
jgi:glycogen operon protein